MLEKTNYANVSIQDLEALLEIRIKSINSLFFSIKDQCIVASQHRNVANYDPFNPKIVDDSSKKIENYISKIRELSSDIEAIKKEISVKQNT